MSENPKQGLKQSESADPEGVAPVDSETVTVVRICRCCGRRPVAIEAWCAWCALIGPTPPDEMDVDQAKRRST